MGIEDFRCLDIIGSMIRGDIQLSDTEFRYYCCCYCPLLQLQDLELSLRVNVHKRATTGFCDVELMLVAEPGKRDMRIVKEFSKIKSVRSNCFFEIYISENCPYNRRTFTLHENEDLVFCRVFQFLSRLNLPTKLFPPLVLLSISLMTCGWTIPSNVKFFIGRMKCWIFLCLVDTFKLARGRELRRIVLGNTNIHSPLWRPRRWWW